ncbi:MAG: hypothetical protein IJV70_07905 [Clostridia bacterium]|nr:hypothetical protein [Clostridia bacterium]
MKKTRFLLILLCFCMLIPLIVACGKDPVPAGEEGDKPRYDDKTRETAADSIPDDYDLEGATIGLFYGTHFDYSVIGDADTTDIVFSKIHERNLSVQDRLNVELNFIGSGSRTWQDSIPFIQEIVQTMSDAYEIIMTSNNTVTGQKLFNYFHDLNDSEYIDVSERWWYEDAIMETSVDNYNYRFLYGDINILDMGVAGTIYYNKDLYTQYVSSTKNPDELYSTVLEGKWTLEEFTRLTKKSHIEKGGDGSNDIHGYSLFRGAEPIHFFREAAGIKMYERNEQGMPIFTLNDDRSLEFLDLLYKCLYENEGAWLFYPGMTGAEEEHSYDFSNGKVMFYIGILNDTLGEGLHVTLKEGLREMKSDFGMLPYPKLNEEQEEYISFMHNASVMTGCPVSADIDRVNEELSAIIEALASESYRHVSVPYYESALKAAYNRDDLSAQMIDIITGQHDTIKSTLTKNFVYEYTNSLGNIGVIFSNLMDNRSTDFASMYASRIGSAETGLRDLIAKYKDGTL